MVRWLRLLVVSAAVVRLGVWSGAGNILDSRAQESGVYRKSQTHDKDQGRKNARRLFDGAGLMTSEETGALEEQVTQCRKRTGMDVAMVTAYNNGSYTAREYVDDFYDQNGLGAGRKANGVLLLIYMDSSGSYGGESYVSTTGNMTRVFTDRRVEQIQGDVTCSLRGLDHAGAAVEFLKDVEYYMDQGIQRGQYNYDTETGEISIYRSIHWNEGMFALLVSAGVADSVCLGVKRRCSMEQTGRERINSLLAYRADTKFASDDSGDNLVHKFITSVPIPRPTQNHSPGSSGQNSGRSSIHRPSSGRSHGGGDRRFQRNAKCVLCTS